MLLQDAFTCVSHATMCASVLTTPIVTNRVTIRPNTWVGGIALQVRLEGDLFPTFKRMVLCNMFISLMSKFKNGFYLNR